MQGAATHGHVVKLDLPDTSITFYCYQYSRAKLAPVVLRYVDLKSQTRPLGFSPRGWSEHERGRGVHRQSRFP